MDTNQQTRDVYTIVTNRIIELLEKGITPWKQPWTDAGAPQNLISKKPYRGINVMLLSSLNYPRNYFLTFKQIKEIGASLIQGEKSHLIVYWKWEEKEDKEGVMKKVPLLRYYTVYNIAQCTGIAEESIAPIHKINKPIQICKDVVKRMPNCPPIRHKEQSAFYHVVEDYVNMPEMKTFEDSASYYSTLFHELVHSTGHEKRLNRKEISDVKGMLRNSYSIEELTAEIGACYLNSFTGIAKDEMKNSIAYIQGWLKQLRGDKRFIVYASTQAQKATDFILNISPVEEKEVAEKEIPQIAEEAIDQYLKKGEISL